MSELTASGLMTRRGFAIGAALAAGALAGVSASGVKAYAEEGSENVFSCETMGIGRVKVTLAFDEGAIVDVQIDASNETELGQGAARILEESILDAQGAEFDTVSSATVTSNAVREAVANCIAQANGEAEPLPIDDLVTPIPAIKEPVPWSYEADVVIVGASCAGLVAATRIAEAGKSVLVVEKESQIGGTARISSCIQVYGGVAGIMGNSDEDGFFSTPYSDYDVVDFFERRCEWTADAPLLLNTAISLREWSKWILDNGANMMLPQAGWWIFWNNLADEERPTTTFTSATRNLLNFEYNLAQAAGAEFHFVTTAKQLVMEDGRCVGFSAIDELGRTVYYHGAEAVVLAADGMQRNHAMIEKYEGLATNTNGAMAKGTGYVIRMGQGAGADMAGIGSFGTNDLHPVLKLEDPNANLMPINTSVNDAFMSLLRMPFFRVDKNCQRITYVSDEKVLVTQGVMGDRSEPSHYGAAQELAHGGSYVIMDSAWYEKSRPFTVFDGGGHGFGPGDQSQVDPYYVPREWGNADLDSAQEAAIASGIVKVADSIEEMAGLLGLDPDKLVAAVDEWNNNVENGYDDPIYGLDPALLSTLDTPPYYGAFCTPCLYGTYAGLKVTPKMEVVGTDGEVIPGLYASFMTAGGLAGMYQSAQCCMGDQIGSAHASGYNVSKAILGEEYVPVGAAVVAGSDAGQDVAVPGGEA